MSKLKILSFSTLDTLDPLGTIKNATVPRKLSLVVHKVLRHFVRLLASPRSLLYLAFHRI